MKIRPFIRLALVAFASFPLQGCINLPPSLFGDTRGPLSLETVIPAERWWTIDKILLIKLTGPVTIEGGAGGLLAGDRAGMLVELKDRLKEAEENDHIKAVILQLDTPGGGVTASDLIHHEIMEFKKKKKIPVVAMMLDVAASGGLYIAMAADEIYAMPTSITGSIGVITLLPGFEELSKKVGFEMRVIKSSENKDLGSPWSSMSDEQREIFQTMIDSMYERFLAKILESRAKTGLTREKLLPFADGRVLDGAEARRVGLIDGTLYTDEVIERAKKLAGIEDAAVVSYEYPYAYRGNVYASSAARPPRIGLPGGDLNLFKLDLGLGSPLMAGARFLYLWSP